MAFIKGFLLGSLFISFSIDMILSVFKFYRLGFVIQLNCGFFIFLLDLN
jgi:hypothetical protein